MARILVIREPVAAAQTARQLEALGHEPVLLPLEQVVRLHTPPPDGPVDGFVVTSAQAVPALSHAFFGDERPCFAVGEATGDALRASGFPTVLTGEGDAGSLVAQIEGFFEAPLPGATLLYAAGRNRSGSLEGGIAGTSVELLAWEVYDIEMKKPADSAISNALEGADLTAVLLLSQAQARSFADIVLPRLQALQRLPRLLCLSGRIADALPQAIREKAEISAVPKLASLFERL